MVQFGNCKIEGTVFYFAIPILKPFPVDCINVEFQKKILDEIQNLEGSYFVDGVTIEYKSLPDIENYSYITRLLSPGRHGFNRMYVFQMSFFNASHLIKPCGNLSAEECFILSMFSYLSTFVYALAYALGIYGDGFFDIDNSIVCYGDGSWKKNPGILNTFPSLYDKDDESCRLVTDLSLKKTLSWFLSIDDVVNACGMTALGKSLSIYSRMFSYGVWDDDFFMSGLLSVMALEALYESNGSKKSLIEKISAFLDIDMQKCEKDIKKIYDHRCSVAHGGFELPFKFDVKDGSEEFENSYNKAQKSFNIGLCYLFKSYRKMILENKKELSFAYKCV